MDVLHIPNYIPNLNRILYWKGVREMKRKKVSYTTVILNGLCAFIFTVRAILEVICQTYYDSIFWFVVNIICAILLIIVFAVNLNRYRTSKKEN